MNTIIDTISRRIEGNAGTGGINWNRLLLIGGGVAVATLALRGIGRVFWALVGFGWMAFWVSQFVL